MATTPISDGDPKNSYTATGGQTTFAYTFWIKESDHLAVFVNGTLQTLTTDYTVSAVQEPTGANVVFNSGLTANDVVVIVYDPDFERTADYTGTIRLDALNIELTYLLTLLQSNQRKVDEAIRPGESETVNFSGTLPSLTSQGGKVFALNSTATGIEYKTVGSADAIVSNFESETFNGDNSTTDFTLSFTPVSSNQLVVFVGGTHQVPGVDYTVSGTTLSFTSAPSTGTDNIEVRNISAAASINTPGDGTVTTAKLADDAVTSDKIDLTDDYTWTGIHTFGEDNSFSGDNAFTGDNTFAGKFSYPDAGEVTISTGAITVTGTNHTIDTEGDAASDDLDTINGGVDGQVLIVRAENAARTVVIKHGTGNIETADGNDITLDELAKEVVLKYDGAISDWHVLSSPPVAAASGDGDPNGGYASGRYMFGKNQYSPSGQALVANTLYGAIVQIGADVTIDKLGINVTATGGTLARLGIYKYENGLPTDLIIDAGTVATNSTGEKEVTGLAQALTPGAYIFAVVSDGTPSLARFSPDQNNIGHFIGRATLGNAVGRFEASHTFGALPSTYPTVTLTGFDPHAVWFRKA